ncbi:cation:proton antiporter [Candidatus Dojkabacteria bacterium]|uniref:Cation:proton antiporter n=1 Tax=Candidatus Dojkabacteria bacterium TaxID=2099670 RepID=A0A955L8A6_9BACT|nr:cation:proton antiporter [Candidatus Dojkabacteria bacterium]
MTGFAEIAILITLASLLGLIANKLRQPPLLGYILAGVIIGSTELIPHEGIESLELFSQIGITFLLFILGLELNIGDLKKLGRVALVTGIGQILFTTLFGYLLSKVQGFQSVTAIYIAIALTFSSTIVIVKLLSTKRELNTLHGKISIGFLLVQDLAAMLILIGLVTFGSSGSAEGSVIGQIGSLMIKIPLLIIAMWVMSKYILPWLIEQTQHDREVLFLLVIAWALILAAVVSSPFFGFSIEIGALLAGISLSSSKESLQIESWTRSLRDFFLTVFFVLLGLHTSVDSLSSIIGPALVFSAFVLIGNPLIVMIIMGLLGYNKRTNFFISLTVAQISEFSLLVAALGLNLGHLTTNEIAILTLVGGITMSVSSYMIYYSQWLYDRLKPVLSIFEFRKSQKRGSYKKKLEDHIVIFGFYRLAEDLLSEILTNPDNFLLVDHDPKTVERLSEKGISIIYGDMNDTDLYEHLNLDSARLILSTISDRSSNDKLLEFKHMQGITTPLILTVSNDTDAQYFYDKGVEYIIYPQLIAGQKLKTIITAEPSELEGKLDRYSKRELSQLGKRFDVDVVISS